MTDMVKSLQRQAARKGLVGRARDRYVWGTVARWEKASRLVREMQESVKSSNPSNPLIPGETE